MIRFLALLLLYFCTLVPSAQATDRYVATCTNGLTTYNPAGVGTCTGGSSLVYSTLTNAMAVAAAGDNIYIRSGTRAGISTSATQPSGTGPAGTTGGYANAVISDFSGATLITVSAYCPGGVCEPVTLTDAGDGAVLGITAHYVSYENLIIDATGTGQPITIKPTAHHIRLQNNELVNGTDNCLQVNEPAHHNWVKNNTMHGCGTNNPSNPFHFHGVYNSDYDSLYEQNTIHDIAGAPVSTRGYCAQNYPNALRNTWRSNTFYNCAGMTNGATGTLIHNNVIRDSDGGIAVINGSGNIIYNNTLVDNINSGIDAAGGSGAFIRNNIVANNGINIYQTGSGATVSHNLCSTTGGGTTNCQVTVANVSAINFTNYAGNDFTLQGSSPAVNAGTLTITGSISIPSCGPVPYCYNAVAPDLGAFEVATIPLVSITAPTSASTYNTSSSTINVSGTSTNSSGTVTWTCDRCTPASGTATGTASWTIPTLTLKVGVNILIVSDGGGSDTLTITYAPGFPGNALVAAYGFEEGSGATATDTTGNGNTGTLINSPTRQGSIRGQGLLFNGTTQYVNVPRVGASLDFTHSFTISAWVKATAGLSNFSAVVVKNGGASGIPYTLYGSVTGYCGDGHVSGFVNVNGASGPGYAACDPGAPLQVGIWTHVAVTYDGANIKLYRQGVLVTTTPATGYMEPSILALDIGHSEFGEFFNGMIDEVRLYSYAIPLTAGANTTPNAACAAAAAISTPSIVGDMNCPVIALSPPIAFKVSGSSTIKFGADKTQKIGSTPP